MKSHRVCSCVSALCAAQADALGTVALLYAAVLAVWFGLRERLGRHGFYLLFALPVTASVQLVGYTWSLRA